jgi:phosphate starvation-inducible protein PhoH and related proteins
MANRKVRGEEKSVGVTKFVPKTQTQKEYMEAILNNKVIVAIGVPGSGKTSVAVNLAIQLILKKEYKRLVMVRPAVEAGEKLGFLPGDLDAKTDPYMRAIYDACGETVPMATINGWKNSGVIEVIPVGFLLGLTLKDSIIIVDEAANCSLQQLIMILTRLGEGSKLIINGDTEQSYIPHSMQGGLDFIYDRFYDADIEGVATIEFTKKDSVRHPLIEKMLNVLQI